MGNSLKGKALGKGIFQRKSDGLYVARYTDRFGKRRNLYGKTEREVRKALEKAVYEDEKQLNVVDPSMTLDEWYEVWISTCKANCRDTTLRTYSTCYNPLRKELGWRTLVSLRLVIIQQTFNKMRSDAMRRRCKAVLVDILNRAVESDLINKNPALGISTVVTRDEKEEKRILTEEEAKMFLDATRKCGNIYKIVLLALNTGMRCGEILGLCWDCVDFDRNVIEVRRTLCYLSNGGDAIYEFHETKTKAGRRTIPMTKEVKLMLLKHKIESGKVKQKPPKEGFEDLVFVSKSNRPLHEANVRCSLAYYINIINMQNPEYLYRPFTMHCLRHTFATNCIEKGITPKTLQKILGHTTLQMTMDLYTHVRPETIRSEMNKFSEMA